MKTSLRKPILLVIVAVVALAMVRLGVWQLGRADEKQAILNKQIEMAEQASVNLTGLEDFARFKQVYVDGSYSTSRNLFVDNQVLDSKVGYLVFTPMRIANSEEFVLVNRGWVPVGNSRAVLPEVITQENKHRVEGRLNLPPAQPPLWDDAASANTESVWQYLPIDEVAAELNLTLLPMVLELAPDFAGEADPALVRRWRTIDNKWVATHHGYAFQWFAMALVFFLACVFLILRSATKHSS